MNFTWLASEEWILPSRNFSRLMMSKCVFFGNRDFCTENKKPFSGNRCYEFKVFFRDLISSSFTATFSYRQFPSFL